LIRIQQADVPQLIVKARLGDQSTALVDQVGFTRRPNATGLRDEAEFCARIDPQRDDGFDLTCGVVMGTDDEFGCIRHGARRERHVRDDRRHQHGFAGECAIQQFRGLFGDQVDRADVAVPHGPNADAILTDDEKPEAVVRIAEFGVSLPQASQCVAGKQRFSVARHRQQFRDLRVQRGICREFAQPGFPGAEPVPESGLGRACCDIGRLHCLHGKLVADLPQAEGADREDQKREQQHAGHGEASYFWRGEVPEGDFA